MVEDSAADQNSIARQVNYANRVLDQAGIQIQNSPPVLFNSMGTPDTAPTLSQETLGSNLILDATPELSPPSEEEINLLRYCQHNGGYDITAYYVQDIKIDGSFPLFGKHYKSGYTNTNSVVVADRADMRTLVHEIGHVLGLDHPNDETGQPHKENGVHPRIHGIQGIQNIKSNFMTQSSDANGQDNFISELQIETMLQNIPLQTFCLP